MVWMLICHLNFQLQHLNFTAEFNILHSSFRIHIIGKCFYTCLLAFYLIVHFQLDKQIVIHCYFLLVLIPEPVLYIWLRCEPCIQYSLAAFRQSPRQISNSTSYSFNSTFEFLFRLQWSLVETKEAFVGWEMATDRHPPPGLFRPSCFVKKRSRLAAHDFYLKPKCCLLCWNVKLFIAAKEGFKVL